MHHQQRPIVTFVNAMRKSPWISFFLVRSEKILLHRILEIEPNCRDETVIRKAYLEKVKQYHPDSKFQESQADHTKFNQVQQAYETLTVNRFAVRAVGSIVSFQETLKLQGSIEETRVSPPSDDEDEIRTKFDIRHTAPQHRTHLEYGGYGSVHRPRSSTIDEIVEPVSASERRANVKRLITRCEQKRPSNVFTNIVRIASRRKREKNWSNERNGGISNQRKANRSFPLDRLIDRLEILLIVWWRIWSKNRCPKAISTTFDRVENLCTNEIRTTWISPPTKSMRFWSIMVKSTFEQICVHFVCAQVTCPTGSFWRKKFDNRSTKRESIWNGFSKRLPRNIRRRRQRSMNTRRISRIIRNGFKQSKNSRVISPQWMWASTSWIWSFQCCGDSRWRVLLFCHQKWEKVIGLVFL